MGDNRGRQKQLAKQKKKRALAQRQVRAARTNHPGPAALLRLAPTLPFGPAFMSSSWHDENAEIPDLVSVVVTRVLPDGDLLAAILLVDRTCFGVKNAFAAPPSTIAELRERLDVLAEMHGGFEETSVHEAQSVIYHAIAFARSLGFEPHRDFPESIVGPRPEVLADTPLARPTRPVFIAGPDDDAPNIRARLAHAQSQLSPHTDEVSS